MSTGLGALGFAAGVAGLGRVLSNVIGIFSGFEKANSNLKAILGATDSDMNILKDSAKELGSTTAFTASQVTALQTEFAKLGFDAAAIDNATESTLALAAAAGVELAEAAAVAGATLGGFGLDAAETGRVTDVMAKSFSTSALDMEKFKESMKSAAPAAKAVGISVERTTALLGTMANAGIAGSKAGNNLKTSLINLNNAGLTLEEGLELVANSQDKLSEATRLVGKNAAASFLVLSEGVDVTERIEKGLNNAAGAAQKMADIQLENLAGDVTILGSAIEGLVLSVESGEGGFNRFLRTVVKTTTRIVSGLTKQTSAVDKNVASLQKEQQVLFELSSELLDTNTNASRRNELLGELEAIYPEMLANIDKETVSYEELRAVLEQANDQLNVRLQIQQALLEVDSITQRLRNERIDLAAKETEIQREIIELFRDEGRQNELLGKSLKERIALTKENFKLAFIFNGLLGDRERILERVAREEKNLNEERKLSNEVITALLSGTKALETLNTKELRALVLNGQLTDKKLIRDAKLIIIQRERDERQKKLNESKSKENDLSKDEKDIITDLIELKREEIKIEKEKAANDIPALAIKNRNLQLLEEELRVLVELGRVKQKDKELDDQLLESDRLLNEILAERAQGVIDAEEEDQKARDLRKAELVRQSEFELSLVKESSDEETLIKERLKNDLAAIDREIIDSSKDRLEAEKQLQRDREALADARINTAKNVADLLSTIAGDDEKRQKQIQDLQKALAVSEILINLRREISGIRENNADKDNGERLNRAQTLQARTAALVGITAVLSAYDGVDDTGGRGDVDGKGGKQWTLHPNEQVLSHANRKEVADPKTGKLRTRRELMDQVHMADNLMMSPHAFKQMEIGNIVQPKDVSFNKMITESKSSAQGIIKAIEDNATREALGLDKLGQLIYSHQKGAVKNTYTIKRSRI